jgi:signal transduction histidine kinase
MGGTGPPRGVAPAVLAVGAASVLVMAGMLLWAWATGWNGTTGVEALGEVPWVLAAAVGVAVGVVVQRRRPGRPATYFAVLLGTAALTGVLDYLAMASAVEGWTPWATAGAAWATETSNIVSTLAAVHLVVTFPDGVVERRWERWILRWSLLTLLLPALLLVVNPVVTTPYWADRPAVPSPLHVPALAIDPDTASTLVDLVNVVIIVAVAAMVARYRRSGPARRARIRWVLLPMVVAGVGAVSGALLRPPNVVLVVVFLTVQLVLYTSVALALLAPAHLDPDRVLRRSLVYGVLWLGITGAWVAAASVIGVTAGRSASLGWAVTLTMAAAVLFQPARRRLERLADRWVFGTRRSPSDVIARMGRTLATTYDLDTLLPTMADALREGLGLDWAEVRLRDARRGAAGDRAAGGLEADNGHDDPVLTVPITRDGEELGEVRCGPRRSGPLTPEEVDLVIAFAHQAALAVGNVRLTRQLAEHAEQLAASRTRLVRAQESERRRIERNIHDGVQQDLVALISQAGRAQRVLERDPATTERELVTLQDGLHRVLDDLRELARGIHPSLLTDRGLLVAVEALAARSPVPTTVRADASLLDRRLPPEVEGAAYFTVAEAVANTLKHADAAHLEVSLARQNGSLLVEVTDDGCGMERTDGTLTTIAERVAAVGGDLTVSSVPGAGTTVRSQLRVDGVAP